MICSDSSRWLVEQELKQGLNMTKTAALMASKSELFGSREARERAGVRLTSLNLAGSF